MTQILKGLLNLFCCEKSSAYRTDIDAAGEEAFCEHRMHLTFKPTSTCCANKVINPGLELEKHWKQCVPQNGQSDSLEGVGVSFCRHVCFF